MAPKCICDKEKEITELSVDSKWIKEKLNSITPKIDSMYETFIKGEGKIKVLNKAIFGNGGQGLMRDVKINSDFRVAQEASEETSKGFWSRIFGDGWVMAFILFFLNIIALVGFWYFKIS